MTMAPGDAVDGNEDAGGVNSPVLRVAYYVVTRFNLYKSTFRDQLSSSEYEKWCEDRANMLLTITAPSLISQTAKSFRWIVTCDTEINGAMDKLFERLAEIDFADVVLVNLRDKPKGAMQIAVSDHIKRGLSRRYTHVSTTRLDSDDAIHSSYIKNLRSRVSQSADVILSRDLTRVQFPYVMTWDGSQFRVGQYPRSHFATVVEPLHQKRPLRTVYFASHAVKMAGDLYVHGKVPAALTCIHGGNVWNTFNDNDLVVVDNGKMLEGFGIDQVLASVSLRGA